MTIDKRTRGFNKLYNSIEINGTDPFVDQTSIDKYGPRKLAVTSYAPPSQALANSYLSYYKEPKEELSCSVRMNHMTLTPRIGENILLNTPDYPNTVSYTHLTLPTKRIV